MPKNDAVAIKDQTALTTYDFSQDGDVNAGLENAAPSRRPAKLVLCQSTTPQSKKSNEDAYIPGLEEGNFFHSSEGTIYGNGPIRFVIVTALPARWIEFFDPKVDGKSGVKDFVIPVGDKRRDFRDDGKGGRLKPIATEFRDFLIFLPDTKELLVLSLKGTQITASEKMVDLAKTMRDPETGDRLSMHRQIFTVTSVVDRKNDYTFYNVKIVRATEKVASDNLFRLVRGAYEEYKNVTIEVTAEAESSEPGAVREGTIVEGEAVPF